MHVWRACLAQEPRYRVLPGPTEKQIISAVPQFVLRMTAAENLPSSPSKFRINYESRQREAYQSASQAACAASSRFSNFKPNDLHVDASERSLHSAIITLFRWNLFRTEVQKEYMKKQWCVSSVNVSEIRFMVKLSFKTGSMGDNNVTKRSGIYCMLFGISPFVKMFYCL